MHINHYECLQTIIDHLVVQTIIDHLVAQISWDHLVVLPVACPHQLPVCIVQPPLPVLQIELELSLVPAPLLPLQHPVPVLLVVYEAAHVFAVSQHLPSLCFLPILEMAFEIGLTDRILALPMEHVFFKLTDITKYLPVELAVAFQEQLLVY